MTDEQAKALGLRAVACSAWRTLPGVVDCDGVQVLRVGGHTIDAFHPRANGIGGQVVMLAGRLGPPDFRDPATRGCLLALVREAWDSPLMTTLARDTRTNPATQPVMPVWSINAGPRPASMDPMGALHRMTMAQHRTEAEALVAALEAAPARVSP
jgi:hypothetical protein